MDHDVFLAKVRYLLVVYLIEQTLDFDDELNAKEIKYLNLDSVQTKKNNVYVKHVCHSLLVKALLKNITFVLEKIAVDIKIFMEVFFKLMNLYPDLDNFNESSIIESENETARGPRDECAEAKSDDSTEYTNSEGSQELSISSDEEEDMSSELFREKIQ